MYASRVCAQQLLLQTASYSAEATALFARMTTPPSGARKTLINNLINSLKLGATSATNIWAKIDVLYVLAAADAQAACLEWKGNAAYNAVPVGAPVFTADRGYAGDGVTADMYLETSYAPGTVSLGMTNADCHFGAWAQNTRTVGIDAGQTAGGWNVRTADGGGAGGRLAGATFIAAPAGVSPHHVAVNRRNLSSAFAYRNGVQGVENINVVALALSTNTWKVMASIAGSVTIDGRISLAHCGKYLNAAENLDLYNAFQTYNTAIGA